MEEELRRVLVRALMAGISLGVAAAGTAAVEAVVNSKQMRKAEKAKPR